MNRNCIAGLQAVWGGAAPGSARSINASRANRYAMADAGARHDQKFATALNSGGLAAAPQPGK
jgi:hypothetical protein